MKQSADYLMQLKISSIFRYKIKVFTSHSHVDKQPYNKKTYNFNLNISTSHCLPKLLLPYNCMELE